MDLLKLNGPLHERIAAALEFAKAHNRNKVDIGKIQSIYGAAHVPFTESTRRFHEEYGGVFTDCVLFDLDESEPIDFTCHIFGCSDVPAGEEARRLHRWHLLGGQLIRQGRNHIAGESEESADESDTTGGQIVPVGEIGHYYPAIVWIDPEGRLIACHDFEEGGVMHSFSSLADFIQWEMETNHYLPTIVREKEGREVPP